MFKWIRDIMRIKSAADRAASAVNQAKSMGAQVSEAAKSGGPDERLLKKKKTPALLDPVVYRTFFVILAALAIIFSFRYYNYHPCSNAGFTVKAIYFYPGETIRFFDNTTGAKEWKWNFGDSSQTEMLQNPLHVFKFQGTYTVTLRVNGRCEVSQKLVIVPLPDSNSSQPKFFVPEILYADVPYQFVDSSRNAKSWSWHFGESANETDSKEKNPFYTFRSVGTKSITLYVNENKSKKLSLNVNVVPNPQKASIKTAAIILRPIRVAPPPGKAIIEIQPEGPSEVLEQPAAAPVIESAWKKAPGAISSRQLESLLENYAAGKTTQELVLLYFCENSEKIIKSNHGSFSIQELLTEINGKRRRLKIKSLQATLNQNGCVIAVDMRYR